MRFLIVFLLFGFFIQTFVGRGNAQDLTLHSQVMVLDSSNDKEGVYADIDNDGDLDLGIQVNVDNPGEPDTTVALFKNDGNGNFSLHQSFVTPDSASVKPNDIESGDIDGDGDLDLLVPVKSNDTTSQPLLRVMVNDGSGNFTLEGFSDSTENPFTSRSAQLVDLDSDNDSDLVLGTTISMVDSNKVFLNDGSGNFSYHDDLADNGMRVKELDAGDVNGDGFPDIAAAGESNGHVYLNDGSGFFPDTSASFPWSTDIALFFADGDSHLDLAWVGSNSNDHVLLGDGNGAFPTSVEDLSNPSFNHELGVGDLDNDGLTDIVDARSDAAKNEIWLNKGIGAFDLYGSSNICCEKTKELLVADFTGDSLADVASIDEVNTRIYKNRCYVTDTIEESICQGDSIQFGGNWYSTPGVYSDTINTPGEVCDSVASLDLSYLKAPEQEICMVTVDSSSTRNLVVWEKPVTDKVAYYRIYRKTGGGYSQIKDVPYDSLSLFVDSTSGVDPQTTSYRYRVAPMDTCGEVKDTSAFHETVHLTSNIGPNGEVNLIWDSYQGFNFSHYRILLDSGSGLNAIDSVPSSNTTYTDQTPPSGNLAYSIEVIRDSACSATRATIVQTRSNRVELAPSSFKGQQENLPSFSLYPVPSEGIVRIQAEEELIDRIERARVLNAMGQEVKTISFGRGKRELDLSSIESGMYYLKLSFEDGDQEVRPLIME